MSHNLRRSTLLVSMMTVSYPAVAADAYPIAAQSPQATPAAAKSMFEYVEPEYANYIFDVEDGSVQRIFSDQINVRISPNMNADTIDTLSLGQPVTVVSKTPRILKLGQRSAHWYKVRYAKEGKEYTGYVWGANFSIGYRSLDGHDFLLGVVPAKDSAMIAMVVNVIKDQQLKQSISIDISAESLSSAQFKWESNKGLERIKGVLMAQVSGEACGIPTTTQYMLWTGDKLIALPVLTSVADAGIFYHNEGYVFPSDKGGKKGQIIKTLKVAEAEDDSDKMTITEQQRTVYLWKDGRLVRQ